MEVRLESPEGAQVMSPSASIGHFAEQTRLRQTQWARRLADDPDAFAEIEQEIDQHYWQGAGHWVAAVLGKVTPQPALAEKTERIRRESADVGVAAARTAGLACGKTRNARRNSGGAKGTWPAGKQRHLDGDSLSEQPRPRGTFELCDLPSTRHPLWQRSYRKRHPSRDQPAVEEQRDVLAARERGSDVCRACDPALRSLGGNAHTGPSHDGA